MIYADITYSKQLADEFQDAEFWWVPFGDKEYQIFDKYQKNSSWYEKKRLHPALTTDILLERLPIKEYVGFNIYCACNCYNVSMRDGKEAFIDKSLPNALAKCLLYLKQEGIL